MLKDLPLLGDLRVLVSTEWIILKQYWSLESFPWESYDYISRNRP